ncbi:hypothetical protein [Deinococcus roseus]|uniref:hypothetical protein n=1 Tax=Deinococcus roseus TaxID=392414 RepID=UPI00166B0300|nr:hypothetical protein [Deinococcus roseus]
MHIQFKNVLIWVDFREPTSGVFYGGIGHEDEEEHQRKEAAPEYWFSDGYKECFREDQQAFQFLDALIQQIAEDLYPQPNTSS